MRKPESPCWQCERHTMTCKEACEDWEAYEEDVKSYREFMSKHRGGYELWNYKIDSINRRKRK